MRRPGFVLLLVLLAVSLGANLVVAGFVLERALDTRSGSERLAERTAYAVVGHLPDAVRDPLLQAILSQKPELDRAVRDIRRSRREVRAAMRAEPLDAARLRDALAETRRRSEALLSMIDDAIAATIAGIPASDRATIKVTGMPAGK